MKSRVTHKPLNRPEGTQLQRVHGGTLEMPTVGLLAGGYGEDKGTASHLLGAATPMMHQCLTCALLEEKAVKAQKKNVLLRNNLWRKILMQDYYMVT